jgi:hypothetical protein
MATKAKRRKRVGPLKPYKDMLNAMYRQIFESAPRQRRRIRDAIYKLSTTNCSWLLYRNRHTLLKMIRDAGTKVDESKLEDSHAPR